MCQQTPQWRGKGEGEREEILEATNIVRALKMQLHYECSRESSTHL
jgi:hypothetical protein